MKIQDYLAKLRGKRVGLLGLGVSNAPLAEMLLRAGAVVTVYDKKNVAELTLCEFSQHMLLGDWNNENKSRPDLLRMRGHVKRWRPSLSGHLSMNESRQPCGAEMSCPN